MAAQVLSAQQLVTQDGPQIQEVRLTAPSGWTPVGGGWVDQMTSVAGSFPDGQDWVFWFHPFAQDRMITVYLVCLPV